MSVSEKKEWKVMKGQWSKEKDQALNQHQQWYEKALEAIQYKRIVEIEKSQQE